MTTLEIDAHLSYDLASAASLLVQVEAADVAGQTIRSADLRTSPLEHEARVPAEAALGTRIWMRAEGRFDARYRATVEVTRPDPDIAALRATPSHLLTGEATSFLMPSRYCQSDLFEPIVGSEFGEHAGGRLVAAIRDWVNANFSYVPGASDAKTTAMDSYLARQGICRDYAHVVVAMARAGGVPARCVSVYAPDVEPPDFHAVAEVWLDGAWHLVDATGMARPSDIAVIGVGRDAAEISFLTIMGAAAMDAQSVTVTRAGRADGAAA